MNSIPPTIRAAAPDPPPLSVVMPVRNALPFLDESVASILGQSFGDFELVILDDCSTDGSLERLHWWAARDPRIRLVESAEPLGPVASSQAVVEHSRAPLVARMDADDVSHPERLRRQIELFEAEPRAGLAGTLHLLIDEAGRTIRGRELAPLSRRLAFLPVTHSSIMFRREAWERAGGYRTGHDYWEDIDLYLRMAETAELFVIPEALSSARFSRTSTRPLAPQRAIEAAYDRMHRRIRGGLPANGRILPQAFVSLATPRIWAGLRPRILKPLLDRGALGFNRESLRALAWAAAAELSPSLLRGAHNVAARLRERLAPQALGRARWLRWRPMEPCLADNATIERRAGAGSGNRTRVTSLEG